MKATQIGMTLAGYVLVALGSLGAFALSVGLYTRQLNAGALAYGAIGGALGLAGAGLLYAAFRSAPPSRWKPAAAAAAALVFLGPSIFVVTGLAIGRHRAGGAPAPAAAGAVRPAASRGLLQALLLCEGALADAPVPEPLLAMLPGERAELEALWPRVDPVDRRIAALLAGSHHLLSWSEEKRVVGVMREWRAGKTAWLARLDEAIARVPEQAGWALAAAQRPAPPAEALADLDPAEREEVVRVWTSLGRARRAELLMLLGTPQKKGAARRLADQAAPNDLQQSQILIGMGEKLLKEGGLEGRTLGEAALAAYDRGDFEGAMGFWLILAFSGDVEAQYSVGSLYAGGKGVPASMASAYRWYALAARGGYGEASPRADAAWARLSESEKTAAADQVGPHVAAAVSTR